MMERTGISVISLLVSSASVAQPTVSLTTGSGTAVRGTTSSFTLPASGIRGTVYDFAVNINLTGTLPALVEVKLQDDESIGTMTINTSGVVPGALTVSVLSLAAGQTYPLVQDIVLGSINGSEVQVIVNDAERLGLPTDKGSIVVHRVGGVAMDAAAGAFLPGDGSINADIIALGGTQSWIQSQGAWVGSVTTPGTLDGSITAPAPVTGSVAVTQVVAGQFASGGNPATGGRIGSSATPFSLEAEGDLRQLFASEFNGTVDLTTSSARGDITQMAIQDIGSGIGSGDFNGALIADSVIASGSGDTFFNVSGALGGTIDIAASLLNISPTAMPRALHQVGDMPSGSLYIVGNVPANAKLDVRPAGSLEGQIIINPDPTGNPTFGWFGDVTVRVVGDLNLSAAPKLQAPYYEVTPFELANGVAPGAGDDPRAGGAIGLVPFNFHPVASVPGYMETLDVSSNALESAIVEHYGPVFDNNGSGTPSIKIFECSIDSNGIMIGTDVTGQFTIVAATATGQNNREVTITPNSSTTWDDLMYCVVAQSDLRCDTGASSPPSVEYKFDANGNGSFDTDEYAYVFMVMTGTTSCPAGITSDVNGDGMISPADFSAWVMAFNTQGAGCDQNGDGLCTPADFSAWVMNFNSGC